MGQRGGRSSSPPPHLGGRQGVVESTVATELFMCTSELCFDNALRHREIDKQPVCMDRGTLLAQ